MQLSKIRTIFTKIEDNFAVIIICSLAILPIWSVFSRVLKIGEIPDSRNIVQQLTLWVCFVGAAIAARKKELLSIGDLGSLLPEKYHKYTKLFVAIIGVVSTSLLLLASLFMNLVSYTRSTTTLGLPSWLVFSCLTIALTLIMFRLSRDSLLGIKSQITIFLFTCIFFWIFTITDENFNLIFEAAKKLTGKSFSWFQIKDSTIEFFEPYQSQKVFIFGVILFLIAAFFKLPIFLVLGGIATLGFWADGTTIASVTIEMTQKISRNASYPALPLFTLAGFILAEGGASKRLVNLFQHIFGWLPGGVAFATTSVCAFFTTFTGASGVTILAMGGLLKPALDERGYSEKTSVGLITGSSALGVLFPPSLPIILYGAFAFQPISDMFLGAFIPGLLLFFIIAFYGMYRGRVEVGKPEPFNLREAIQALKDAKWEASLPFLVFAVLISGPTIVETAALTVLYAFISEFIVHKDLSIRKDFTRVISYSTVLIGGVLIILAGALGFSNYIIDIELPSKLTALVKANIESPLVFLLFLNIFLLIAGCMMDMYTAIVVISPLLILLAQTYNINPVHMGVIFLTNLSVGYLTPPVGMNLFISSYCFKKSMPEVYRA
ncbi:MAG: C4-dicarboxylate transporter DctM subunit, partial [bacterium]